MKLVRSLCCICAVLIYSTSSYGVVLNVNNGILVGASNVDVNGILYDVSFLDGTCSDLYSGCDQNTDFPFTNLSDLGDTTLGNAANTALLDQVFIDSSLGLFDSTPSLTNGCTATTLCGIQTPFSISQGGAGLGFLATVNYAAEHRDTIGSGAGQLALDSSSQEAVTYAVWSISQPNPVPVPAAVWLFGSGFIGLIGIRRKSSKVSTLSA